MRIVVVVDDVVVGVVGRPESQVEGVERDFAPVRIRSEAARRPLQPGRRGHRQIDLDNLIHIQLLPSRCQVKRIASCQVSG